MNGYTRLLAFLSILLLMLAWEYFFPRRPTPNKKKRTLINFAFSLFNSAFVRVFLPLLAVDVALMAEQKGLGLFNLWARSYPLKVTLSIILLDLLIYWQHRIFHQSYFFLRFHRMHHSDIEFDTTTGLRFHPVEILFSMLIKMLAVLLLGAPVSAVIIFEILLNGSSLFNHGNVVLAQKLERLLRYLIVTPDMHRIHHSVERFEHDSNFGFTTSLWDRIFFSYRAQARDGQSKMSLGLAEYRQVSEQSFWALLKQPFH